MTQEDVFEGRLQYVLFLLRTIRRGICKATELATA